MSLVCSREVIQLISSKIILSLQSMYVIPKPILYHHHSVSNHDTHFFCWWGIHQGPPTMSHFLLRSTHYLRSWLRNNPSVPWCLHTSMTSFFTLGERFTSLDFDRHILCRVRLHLIHSHHMDCNAVPWGPLTSSVVSLTYVDELNHWMIIRWCLPCSTPTH